MRARSRFHPAGAAELRRSPEHRPSGLRTRGLWLTIALGLAAAAVLAGCVHPSQYNREAAATPAAGYAADEIAAVAATGAVHSSVPVHSGRFGEGQATVGEQYFSALGIPCRKVMFVGSAGGSSRELTVCMEKNGVWSTAPDIFSGPVVAAAKP